MFLLARVECTRFGRVDEPMYITTSTSCYKSLKPTTAKPQNSGSGIFQSLMSQPFLIRFDWTQYIFPAF